MRASLAVTLWGRKSLMQLERIAPPGFVTEGVEAKYLPAQVDCGLRVVVHLLVVS